MRDLRSSLFRFAAAAARLLLWPARLVGARAALGALATLNARELADIGLSPTDLRDATALPRDVDPTDFLAMRAGAKRASAERPLRRRADRRSAYGLAKTGS